MSTLLPQPFWFRVAHSCWRVVDIPHPKGRPLDLGESSRLADLAELAGPPGWLDVRSAWNDGGIGFAFEATGPAGPTARTAELAAVQLWVDTRDTRTIHRATRFCHRFQVALLPAGGRNLIASIAAKPIPRAMADPKVDAEKVRAWAERTDAGWRLELFFPADALAGFDPEANRRLGLAYQVNDAARGEAYSGVGREFPVGEDPSLWATLVLNDAP